MRVSIALLLLVSDLALASAKIDPALAKFGRGESGKEKIRIIALLAPPEGLEAAPRKYDRARVLSYLRRRAKLAWKQVEDYLTEKGALRSSVRLAKLYVVNTSFAADVTPEGLRALARAPGVKKIYANHRVRREPGTGEQQNGRKTIEQGLSYAFRDTGLEQLMHEHPQITGKGVILGHLDTGVDASHPALAGKVLKFYDDRKRGPGDPYDADSHGTHTAGTMVGGDRSRVLIGVAPDAKLIAAGSLDGIDSELRGMEFMLSPAASVNDGDDDGRAGAFPRAINNSWTSRGAPDQEPFYRAISAWEAAGILPVFSAGNAEGNEDCVVTPPHEHPAVLAVGALGPGGRIARFSCHGPGTFKGEDTQKPDLAAPGLKILSSLPGGRYGEDSGTSMAAPHVTGTVALLLQVNPSFTPAQLRALLVKTADPKSESGSDGEAGAWNPRYGFGNLNIFAAVKKAVEVTNRQQSGAMAALSMVTTFFQSPDELDTAELLAARPDTGTLDMDSPVPGFEGQWLDSF